MTTSNNADHRNKNDQQEEPQTQWTNYSRRQRRLPLALWLQSWNSLRREASSDTDGSVWVGGQWSPCLSPPQTTDGSVWVGGQWSPCLSPATNHRWECMGWGSMEPVSVPRHKPLMGVCGLGSWSPCLSPRHKPLMGVCGLGANGARVCPPPQTTDVSVWGWGHGARVWMWVCGLGAIESVPVTCNNFVLS